MITITISGPYATIHAGRYAVTVKHGRKCDERIKRMKLRTRARHQEIVNMIYLEKAAGLSGRKAIVKVAERIGKSPSTVKQVWLKRSDYEACTFAASHNDICLHG